MEVSGTQIWRWNLPEDFTQLNYKGSKAAMRGFKVSTYRTRQDQITEIYTYSKQKNMTLKFGLLVGLCLKILFFSVLLG